MAVLSQSCARATPALLTAVAMEEDESLAASVREDCADDPAQHRDRDKADR